MIVLGIESSCDETACAIVTDDKQVLSSVVWSQYDEHRRFGGVVPEIAARAHLEKVDLIVGQAMREAGLSFKDLSAVAVAGGPGLIGGVLVGVITAKSIAMAHDLPFLAVNHLEGHALMARLTEDISFPYLLLLVSGGHCQILAVKAPGQYERFGGTIDDSAGEAFDKVAKMLGIGYPGGPAVEKWALRGNGKRFAFPRPMKGRQECNFSFSGLKTAVRSQIEQLGTLGDQDKADIAASFQAAVVDVIDDRMKKGITAFKEKYPEGRDLVVSGGVAANMAIRDSLMKLAQKNNMNFAAPPLKCCTDNGLMIAWAGVERFKAGLVSDFDFAARPRWPLDMTTE